MNSQVNRLVFRVLGLELLSSVAVFLILSMSRWLLVLETRPADASVYLLGMAILLGGFVAPVRSVISLHRYRFLLRALALGSSAVEMQDLVGLSREAFRFNDDLAAVERDGDCHPGHVRASGPARSRGHA